MARNKLKDSSPMVDNSDVDYELNKTMINHCLKMSDQEDPDLSNPDEVKKAISYYFNSCITSGLRPGNLGLYAALGLDKTSVHNLITERVKSVNGKSVSPASILLIKKAIKHLSGYRELLGMQGKLAPPTLIFWAKNFDGMEDVQRMELSTADVPKADLSPEEIKAQIEQDIPLDVDYNEID